MTGLIGIKAISFDVDGTLWDFEGVMRRSLGIVLTELERFDPEAAAMLSVDRMVAIRDKTHEDLKGTVLDLEEVRREGFRRALGCAGRSNDELAARLAKVYFKHFYSGRLLFEDARPALEALSRRYALGVFSNGNSYPEHLGLEDLITFAVYPQDHARIEKPDPRIFQIALEAAGCSAGELLHVGDSLETDVAGAANAGIRCVWLNRNGREPDIQPDLEVQDLRQLVDVLA